MAVLHSERALALEGSFPAMETPAQYRKFADECERLAKQARAAHHRKVLEEMARVWRELAARADGKH